MRILSSVIGTLSIIIRLEPKCVKCLGMTPKRGLAKNNAVFKMKHKSSPLELNLNSWITEASNGQRFNQTSTMLLLQGNSGLK